MELIVVPECIVQSALCNTMHCGIPWNRFTPPPPPKKNHQQGIRLNCNSNIYKHNMLSAFFFHHNELQLITYLEHFVIPLDVTRCHSLAADMASQQLAPISVHDLVKFRDHTCIVTEIRNQHGFNTFQLQDLDTGEIVRAFRFQLKVIDSGPLITELSSDFEMAGAEETVTKTKTAGDRFVPMTSQDLDDLASKRTSQATKGQTKWAVQVFKGKHVSMFMFTCRFRPQLGQGWGDRSGHALSELRRHSVSAWSVNWLKVSELCKYTNLRFFCICRHAVNPVNHRRWRGKLGRNSIRVVAMILRRCLSVFPLALSKS